tara:strand:+ start:1475 stop:1798 length:324 start_codon:yes stop_codon:yes gene_type:complete
MVEIFLATSALLNLFLVWYTWSTLRNLLYLSDNLGLLYEMVLAFSLHLKKVYELERFYGDPTLTNLLEHSNALRDELEKFEDVFLLSEPPNLDEEEDDDGSKETEEN